VPTDLAVRGAASLGLGADALLRSVGIDTGVYNGPAAGR
jgi:hypothetical protein